MKHLLFMLCLAPALFSCGSGSADYAMARDVDTLPVTDPAEPQTLCFERRKGDKNLDVVAVQLSLQGDQVSGTFASLPHQKDAAVGSLQGRKEGEIIKTQWYFTQEGVMDTIVLELKLSNGQLLQKPLSYDEKTGEPYLKDDSPFSLAFEKIDCGALPESERN